MTRAGAALVWALVVALAFAPATTAPAQRAAMPPVDDAGALDLSARWPILLDASTRVLAPHGGERALARTQRRPTLPLRLRPARARPREGLAPRRRELSELGRRQTDGG